MCLDMCPNKCGQAKPYRRTESIRFKGEIIEVCYESYVCPECGLDFLTIKQGVKRQKNIADEYRKRCGLMTGEEMVKNRKNLGYTQERVAVLTGIGVASIKRWENGCVQTRSMDLILRAIYKDGTNGCSI